MKFQRGQRVWVGQHDSPAYVSDYHSDISEGAGHVLLRPEVGDAHTSAALLSHVTPFAESSGVLKARILAAFQHFNAEQELPSLLLQAAAEFFVSGVEPEWAWLANEVRHQMRALAEDGAYDMGEQS